MSNDIRSYFSSKTDKVDTTRKNKRIFASEPVKRTFIESDSESDEAPNVKKKRGSHDSVKNLPSFHIKKHSINSSDEEISAVHKSKKKKVDLNGIRKRQRKTACLDSSDEDISPPKAKYLNRKKLTNSSVMRNFKPVSVADVFSKEPIKHVKSKVRETIKKTEQKPDLNESLEDEEFEAALVQLDEVGENWTRTTKRDKEMDKGDKIVNLKNQHLKLENKTKKEYETSDLCISSMTVEADKHFGNLSNSEISFRDSQDSGVSLTPETPCVLNKKVSSVESEKHFCNLLDSQSSFKDSQDSGIYLTPCELNKKSGSAQEKVNVKISKKSSPDIIERCSVVISDKDSSKSKSDAITSTTPLVISDTQLWVEKYKPQSSNKIIGQQGDNSNVKKLINWLKNWNKNNRGVKKSISGGWNKDSTGANSKAAILCGPPGVGKTTTVSLVCKELGFDIVEFNASDTRSKRLLQVEVSELLTSTSLNPVFKNTHGGVTRNHVLVMDEVDGMAGNEDRGGIQELIQLIKSSKVPIICMCNDRAHPKIRTLLNYCFELRFSKPRLEQIKGYMMSICYREKLNIQPNVLMDIITATNHDIRLTLNHLSMLAADKTNVNLDSNTKNIKLGPWDVLRKVFSREEHKNMSMVDRCDLFFYDYSIAPLFVHENYLTIKPSDPAAKDKRENMKLFAAAANSICYGEEIEACIRKTSTWSLLPVQAIFSSYAPGQLLEGYCTSQINFPSWFGQNSKQSKINRLLQDIQMHTRLKVSGSKLAIGLDYVYHLKNNIIRPLLMDGIGGVKQAISRLCHYQLLREDLDSLNEITSLSTNNENTSFTKVDSKVKAAFTRAYNKDAPMQPYSLVAPVKKGKGAVIDTEDENAIDNFEVSEDEEDKNVDPMIVEKKKNAGKKSTETIAAATSSKQSVKKTNAKKEKKK